MARFRVQHVHRDERGPAAQWGTVRQHVEPQFRRAPGKRRADAPGEPDHGRGGGAGGAFCGCEEDDVGREERKREKKSGKVRKRYHRGTEDTETHRGEEKAVQAFRKHTGLVVPLDRVNVDTDQMVPKQFLTWVTRQGYGRVLFYDWRYLDGERPNPAFVLNLPRYRGASALLARANFGCGSSREHAPWAVLDYGIRAIIAPSFADIFYNNCFKNGILPVSLSEAQVDDLFRRTEAQPGYQLSVNLEEQTVRDAGGLEIRFDLDPFRRDVLLKGLDDIGVSLLHENEIASYEARVHPAARLAEDSTLDMLLPTGATTKK